MKYIFKKILLVFFLVLTYGCTESTITGNPLRNATGFTAIAQFDPPIAAFSLWNSISNLFFPTAFATSQTFPDASGRVVSVNGAWIALKDIEFKETQFVDGSEGNDIKFVGPYYINLMTTNPAAVDVMNTEMITYKRVISSLHKEQFVPPQVPVQMQNKSIYLFGTVDGIQFEFSSEESFNLEISGATSITPEPGKNLILAFYFRRLIKKIDLSLISSFTVISDSNKVDAIDPCPEIDPDASDLYTCFKVGLEIESTLGLDSNGDFEIGADDPTIDD